MLYAAMSAISIIVRQFCLPNPFVCFGNNAALYNYLAGVLISPVAYSLVSIVYRSGDCPLLGSFLYLLAYAAITGILALMGIFSFAWWWVLVIAIVALIVAGLLAKLWRCLNGETW